MRKKLDVYDPGKLKGLGLTRRGMMLMMATRQTHSEAA